MATISIKEAKDKLTELARRVEAGETIVITRNGRPVADLVPHRSRNGVDLSGVERFKKEHGLKTLIAYIAEDFDAPLDEDFLTKPLPESR